MLRKIRKYFVLNIFQIWKVMTKTFLSALWLADLHSVWDKYWLCVITERGAPVAGSSSPVPQLQPRNPLKTFLFRVFQQLISEEKK